jgi:large subunit ribosomal protein L29
MKAQEAHTMVDAELAGAINNARRELFNLRFQHVSGRLGDTSRLRAVRRDLARLLTTQRERQLWSEQGDLTEEA